jgi:fumarate reductase flavoprotein subunit
VHLDLRHLGAKKLHERLPFICELAKAYVGVDPVEAPIPVRPAVHYTMGGIKTDISTATALPGLYAVGECASCGLHGANRLGSNSLAELLVFGKAAGSQAAEYAQSVEFSGQASLESQAGEAADRARAVAKSDGVESIASIRDEMVKAMEKGTGIYRTGELMQEACDKIAELKDRYKRIKLDDHSEVFNTEWLYAIELGFQLDVAEAMAHSAVNRKESRGAHQRLDGFEERDDEQFLKHSLAYYVPDGPPRIDYGEVIITTSPPGKRAYGAEGEALDKAKSEQQVA